MFPRLLSVIAFVTFFTASQIAADIIDDARQDYINGDYSKALAVIEPAARAGNALAQNLMGAAYNEGHGVEQNTGTSIEWFMKSAAQGNAKAQYNLGGLYLLGDATGEPDYRKAIEYLELAMAQDYPPAFMIRGRVIRFGFGQGPDPAAAIPLFQRALDLGSGAAGNDLAEMYRTGEGVGVDETKAREFYRQAAATGYALAIGNLGVMHQYGIGGRVMLLQHMRCWPSRPIWAIRVAKSIWQNLLQRFRGTGARILVVTGHMSCVWARFRMLSPTKQTGMAKDARCWQKT